MVVCLSGDPLLPAILRASLLESAASLSLVLGAMSAERVHRAVPHRVVNAASARPAWPFASWARHEITADGAADGGLRREPSSIMAALVPDPKAATLHVRWQKPIAGSSPSNPRKIGTRPRAESCARDAIRAHSSFAYPVGCVPPTRDMAGPSLVGQGEGISPGVAMIVWKPTSRRSVQGDDAQRVGTFALSISPSHAFRPWCGHLGHNGEWNEQGSQRHNENVGLGSDLGLHHEMISPSIPTTARILRIPTPARGRRK